MLEDIKRWLATQLIAINSVRHCAIKPEEIRDPERDPSITVFTWSSTIIHVFLLPQFPRARTIKRILSEGTRLGIGTLFIVNDELLPADGERFEPDDVLTMLHALYKDKIYTYRVEDDGPKIGQTHFKPFGRADQTEVWYGPDIVIAHLPSYRVWINTPSSIKGDWLIANFGTEAFWKKAENTAERENFRRQYRRANGSTWHFAWSPGSSWAEAGGEKVEAPPPPTADAKLEQSLAMLGLSGGASHEDVKAAFRQMARELHPDVSKLPKDEAEARFKRINEAYTYIKVTNRWT